jgi:hypothetical protein
MMRRRHVRAGEQARDPRPTELAGWQADAVKHDEIGRHAGRARVEERRQHLSHAHEQAGSDIDAHANSSRASCHTRMPQ